VLQELGFEEVGIHIEDGRLVWSKSKVPIARKKHDIQIPRYADCSHSSFHRGCSLSLPQVVADDSQEMLLLLYPRIAGEGRRLEFQNENGNQGVNLLKMNCCTLGIGNILG